MSNITKPVAHALAFRWGELQEEPPAFIDDLMIDLTEALLEAESTGNEARSKCLDEVLDALAQGIAKHQTSQVLDAETLGRSIRQIRACYYRKSEALSAKELKNSTPCSFHFSMASSSHLSEE